MFYLITFLYLIHYSLSLKDVMGLINDLKLEKNCQVIVILHDSKANEQFQEYKEKVLDEILVLDDNLDALENSITDKLALDVMQLFYRKIRIKNLRFYKKVFNNYRQIIENIDSLSDTSKKHVLRNLLVIQWIDDFQPEISLEDDEHYFKVTLDFFQDESNNFIEMSDDNFLKQSKDFKAFRNHLEPFYPLFLFDNWAKHIIDMLTNHDISEDSIKGLLEEDILSEAKIQAELLHEQVMNEFYSLKLQPNFCERLYYLACTKIQKSELNNISFYCDIFENCNREDLSEQMGNHIKQFIKQEISLSQTKPSIDEWYHFGVKPYDRFFNLVRAEIDSYQPKNIEPNVIASIFMKFYESGNSAYSTNDEMFLKEISKDILRQVIWVEINNERYRRHFIHSILKHPLLNEIEGKREEVRKWIVELLKEKIEESSGSEVPIKMWLKSTNNLTEGLS